MSERENVRLIRRAYEISKAGDVPSLLNMLADDVQWLAHAAQAASAK